MPTATTNQPLAPTLDDAEFQRLLAATGRAFGALDSGEGEHRLPLIFPFLLLISLLVAFAICQDDRVRKVGPTLRSDPPQFKRHNQQGVGIGLAANVPLTTHNADLCIR